MRILFIDIPNYTPTLPCRYKELLRTRLELEDSIIKNRCNVLLKRGTLNYSRGLLTVATHVKNWGHQIDYLVFTGDETREEIASLLKRAELIAITCMTPTVNIASNICTLAKNLNPQVLTVVGGPHINSAAEETLNLFHHIDVALVGRGEVSFSELLRDIESKNKVKGIIRDNNEQILSPIKPDYTILGRPLNCFAHNLRTQENCIFNCSYCVDGQNSKRYHPHQCIDVFDELSNIANQCDQQTLIHFSDAIFTVDKKRIRILRRLLSNLQKVYFSIDTRIDMLDEELISDLTDMGVIYYRLGIENVDETNSKIKDILKRLEYLSQLIRKISPQAVLHGYWLTGLPGSTQQSFIHNADAMQYLIDGNILDVISNKIFVPYPGTQYYQNPSAFGLYNLKYDWANYDRFSYPVYDLANLTSNEIYEGFIYQEKRLIDAYIKKNSGIKVSGQSIDYKFHVYLD